MHQLPRLPLHVRPRLARLAVRGQVRGLQVKLQQELIYAARSRAAELARSKKRCHACLMYEDQRASTQSLACLTVQPLLSEIE